MLTPGMLCVCITDMKARLSGCTYGDETIPAQGIVYTVREVIPRTPPYPEDFLRLVEIVNAPRAYAYVGVCEIAFRVDQFRPLDANRLAVFRQTVAPVPVREDA